MARLYDISDWNEQSWWNTGGTRDKKIYQNPSDGELYYFKQSFKKGQRDYKYEFWSEIVASEIGLYLDFHVLPYDVAVRNEIVGCISKSMINSASEELIEGGKYIQAFDNTFNPADVKARNKYSFELITKALIAFHQEDIFPKFIEMLVFDALIGNSDRHQENWATINNHTILSKAVSGIEKDMQEGEFEKAFNWIKKFLNKNLSNIQAVRLMLPKQTRFSPIYDSGCSFGRELNDERILVMLRDEIEIEKYIDKGKSEIHWGTQKISHFKLLENLLKNDLFKGDVLNTISRIIDLFDNEKIQKIVYNIDVELINIENTHALPDIRKELMFKLLILRFRKLRELYSGYK